MDRFLIFLENIFSQSVKYLVIILPLLLVINYNLYPFDLVFSRVFVLSAIIILVLLKFPLTPKTKKLYFLKYIDYALIALTVLMAIYSYFELDKFIEHTGFGTPMYQLIMAAVFTFLVYESTRRIAGPVLPTMALILFGYAIYRGYRYSRIITEIFSYEGIFGIAFSLAISVVFMFLLFGSFLNNANFGNFLLKLGTTLVGGMSGGPAKIAVVSSSLFGTISGSAVANTVGTGTFTIPLMKKTGFEPHIAGAIEASASTGGQIMPPVMAAAAFVIAEILQVPYIEVARAGLLPALAYYVGIFTTVDAYSKKRGLKGIPKNQRPSIIESLKEGGHLLLIIFVLIAFLIRRIDPLRAAFLTILVLFPLSYLSKKTRLNLKKTTDALSDASYNLLLIGSSTATVGSIIACIALTGLGGKIANSIIGIGGQNILPVMFLVMFTCLIFGMALPTTASYIVLIAIVGPSLIEFGIVPMAAHLFILYFGVLSNITPPVAMAAYAGAGIAGANMFQTAIMAVKLAAVAFIIPYIFVLTPAVLLTGEKYPSLLYIVIMYVLILPISLAWGIWGHTFLKRLFLFERIFYLLIAVLIVYSALSQVYFGIYLLIPWIIFTMLIHSYNRIPFLNKLFIIKQEIK